jgi:hypothetical protein
MRAARSSTVSRWSTGEGVSVIAVTGDGGASREGSRSAEAAGSSAGTGVTDGRRDRLVSRDLHGNRVGLRDMPTYRHRPAVN